MDSSANVAYSGSSRLRSADCTFIVCALAITMLSCLINFAGITRSEVIDDHDLLHSRLVRGCGRNPVDCFRHSQFGLYYRPIMGASFSVGENLHGQDPLPFHIENLVLHAMVMIEACWAFRLLLRRDRSALLAGLLYGVHALQVPVTTFIGGRTDSLASLFVFWFVIGAANSQTRRYSRVWRAVSLAGFTAAIFCKEQCIPLVFLLPLLAQHARCMDGKGRHGCGILQPWMLLFLCPVGILFAAAQHIIPAHAIDTVVWRATPTQVSWDLGLRIEMVGRTLWYYARCFLWPAVHTLHQSSLGPWDNPQPLTAFGGFFAAGIWVALTVHSWRYSGARILALWAILTLAPCLNIIPIPSQFVGCYRAVIPLFGIAGLAGLLCDRLALGLSRSSGAVLAWAIPAAVAAALVILAAADVPVWRSDAAVTLAEFQGDPNFLPALAGYAISVRREGRTREAVAISNRVVSRLFPNQNTLAERLAVIDAPWMLRHVKSQSSLRYQPRPFIDYVMRERGGELHDLGLYLPAIEDYRLALAAEPNDFDVADALVYCCDISGKYDAEREALETTIARAPTSARLHRLGATYMHLGRWLDAKHALARALAIAVREKSSDAQAILRMYDR